MVAHPHDALFKATFGAPEHALALFRAVLPPEVFAALDWRDLRLESASFVDAELADHHGDLLFSVPRTDGSGRVLLYVLVEHQSQPDAAMPLRLLGYLVQIWERARRDAPGTPLPLVIPFVFSHAPGGWSAPRALEQLFAPEVTAVTAALADYLPRFRILVEDIAHLSDDDIAARVDGVGPQVVWWALRDARDRRRLVASAHRWRDRLVELRRQEPRLYEQLETYFAQVTDKFSVDEFRAMLTNNERDDEGNTMSTIWEKAVEEGLAKGLTRGREEGRQQGREEGRRETLRKLLVLKFGAVSPTFDAQLAAASAVQLERYLERVLVADSIAAVLAD